MKIIKNVIFILFVTLMMGYAGGDIKPTSTDEGFYFIGKIGAGQTFESSNWDYFSCGKENDRYGLIGFGFGYRYRYDPIWFIDGEFGIYTSFNEDGDADRTDYDISIRPGYTFTNYGIDFFGIIAETYTKLETDTSDWTLGAGVGIGYPLTKNTKITFDYQYQLQDFDNTNNVRNDKALVGFKYSF